MNFVKQSTRVCNLIMRNVEPTEIFFVYVKETVALI